MPKLPKFSVIIVNWNVTPLLINCLKSVAGTGYPNLQALVIDNHSDDFDPQTLAKTKLNLTLVQNKINLGFPKAVNIGLRRSVGNYLVILNPDTLVPKSFFASCLDFFRRFPDCWLMGPKFINPDGSTQGSVFPEPSIWSTFQEFWLNRGSPTQKYAPAGTNPVRVNSVSGGCFVMPRSTYTRVGDFTERVFMYYEDLDYCRRIRALSGPIYYNPQIVITHVHGQSSQKSPNSTKYLTESSKWYNGKLKHYLMWVLSLTGQKLRQLFL